MAAYQKVVETTFDTAAMRIRDSIDHLQEIGEPLDGWQTDMLARALAYLQSGNQALAIDAAFQACRPQFYRTHAAVIALSDSPTLTINEVRAELDRVTGDRAA